MLKHRHSSFSGEILQNIPLLHFEMLAGLRLCDIEVSSVDRCYLTFEFDWLMVT